MAGGFVVQRITNPGGLERASIDDLIRGSLRDFVPPLDKRVVLDSYLEKLATRACFSLAYDGARLVGVYAFYANDSESKVSYGTLMVVHPDFRGLKLGEALMEDAVRWATSLGMTRMRLETWSTNTRAIALYSKLQFREVGRCARDGACDIESVTLERNI